MGVPGVMEPLRYDGHVYCDGGMTNDFPLGALPNDGGRLGLLVRPRDWYAYKLGPLDHLVGASALNSRAASGNARTPPPRAAKARAAPRGASATGAARYGHLHGRTFTGTLAAFEPEDDGERGYPLLRCPIALCILCACVIAMHNNNN